MTSRQFNVNENGITYKMTEPKALNVKYNGRKIKYASYTKEGGFTKQQIERIINRQRETYKDDHPDRDIIMMCSIKYNDKWRSTKYMDVNNYMGVQLDSYDDDIIDAPTHFNKFVVYVSSVKKSGGSDKHNDCLYNALQSVLKKKMKLTAEQFKKKLKLRRDDLIPVSMIPTIEKYLKEYNINVYGDKTYQSARGEKYEIDLKLSKGHYEVFISENKKYDRYVSGISLQEKPILIYQIFKNEVMTYDGKRFKSHERKEFFTTIDRKPRSFKYIPVHKDENKTYIEAYNDFIKCAEQLKSLSGGRINLYKTGRRETMTALKLFYETQYLINPEPIDQLEAEWIDNAVMGAIMRCEKGYRGPAYKYDKRSFYPSLMNTKHTQYPIKKGEFKRLSNNEFEEYIKNLIVKYGIYRCKISEHYLFRNNPNNFYTHADIQLAKYLNLKIELIIDDKPNALIYDDNKLIRRNILFGEFIDIVYPLKQVNHYAKSILNCLWGALSERKTYKQTVRETDDELNIIDAVITKQHPKDDGNGHYFEFVNNDRRFYTSYARIKPFILGYGRRRLITGLNLDKRMDEIVYIHTDGFITKTKQIFDESYMKNEIGYLKYEGYCEECNIKDMMSKSGEFVI